MKQFLLLARVLRKCGKGNEKQDQQADLKGDNTLLLYVIGGLILPVALFFVGRFFGPLSILLGGVEPFMATLFPPCPKGFAGIPICNFVPFPRKK